MPNLYTHTHHTLISELFGDVKFYSLRGEGRRGWEGTEGSKNETFDYIRLD